MPAGKGVLMAGLVNSGGKGIASWLSRLTRSPEHLCVFVEALPSPFPSWVEGRGFIFSPGVFLRKAKRN